MISSETKLVFIQYLVFIWKSRILLYMSLSSIFENVDKSEIGR